jgi:hypothetical protein
MIVIRSWNWIGGQPAAVKKDRVRPPVYLVLVEGETERAILVWHPDKTRTVWLAKSQVSVKPCSVRAQVRLRMPAWLARTEGFEGFEMGGGN